MNKKYKVQLRVQMLLTGFSTLLSIYNLITTLINGAPLLNTISAIMFFLNHVILILYVTKRNTENADTYFKGAAYAYAALIGLQIVSSGYYIVGYGLSEPLTLFINIVNIIAFGNIIQFINHLDKQKDAIYYLGLAVLSKLIAELALIIILFEQVKPTQILMSLSIPILGITILLAYLYRANNQGA